LQGLAGPSIPRDGWLTFNSAAGLGDAVPVCGHAHAKETEVSGANQPIQMTATAIGYFALALVAALTKLDHNALHCLDECKNFCTNLTCENRQVPY
jgi:hypothetical protein